MQETNKYNTSCRVHSQEFIINHVAHSITWSKQDCPYCEIDRLTTQLSEARASAKAWQENCRLTEEELEKERNKHADLIGKLAKRDAEIEKLAKDCLVALAGAVCTPLEGYRKAGFHWLVRDIKTLVSENAALRAEVERLKEESSHLWVRIESGEAAAYEQGKAEARKQTALEIEAHLLSQPWTIPHHETEAMIDRDDAIYWLQETYGLEGW